MAHNPVEFEQKVLQDVLEIESFARGTRNQILEILKEAEAEGLARLEALAPGAVFTRRLLGQLMTEIRSILDFSYPSRILPLLQEDRIEAIKMAYDAMAEDLVESIKESATEAPPTKLRTRQLQALASNAILGRTLPSWMDRQRVGLAGQIRRELMKSVVLNETVDKAKRRLVNGFGFSRSSADLIARTALLQAASDARDQVYRDNDSFIKGYQYLATLDIRVCPICAKDDGRIARRRESLPALPRHPRCRCTIIPLTEISDDFALDRPAVTDQESHTTQHRDGSTTTRFRPLATKQTAAKFPEFFKRQPAKWQREWLGAERFKLWQEGALTDIRELATNRRVNTLDELKVRMKKNPPDPEDKKRKPVQQPGQSSNKRKAPK